jgi:hypothetical protein
MMIERDLYVYLFAGGEGDRVGEGDRAEGGAGAKRGADELRRDRQGGVPDPLEDVPVGEHDLPKEVGDVEAHTKPRAEVGVALFVDQGHAGADQGDEGDTERAYDHEEAVVKLPREEAEEAG